MAITERAKAYHEKMFPGYVSSFLTTDPEFIEFFDSFAFDEVVNHDDLDDRTRFMAILSVLLGCQGIDEFRAMLPAAMNFGLTPVEIKEISISGGGVPGHRAYVPLPEGDKRSAAGAGGRAAVGGAIHNHTGEPLGSGHSKAGGYFRGRHAGFLEVWS